MIRIPFRRPALALVAALSVTGCAGLGAISNVTTPTDLYLLTPKSTFDPSLPELNDQIVVEEPTATAAVDTDRITVQPTPLRVQYLPRARWIDRAPLIVQSLLIESFENTDKVGAVGSSTVGLRADYIVVTDIREFQAHVVGEEDALSVDVRLNIKLVDGATDRIIASQSFFEVVLSETSDAPDVVAAFDEALGGTMRDAVEWSIRRMASHSARNPRVSY